MLVPAAAIGASAWRALAAPAIPMVGVSPDIAVDPTGNVVSVWMAGSFAYGAYRPVDTGEWRVFAVGSGDIPQAPSVVIDATGTATLGWVHRRQNDVVIQTMRRSAKSRVSPLPSIASGALTFASSIDLAVDAAGNVTAVWVGYSDSRYRVQSAELAAGSTEWSAVRELANADEQMGSVRLALSPSGRAAAVWTERVGVEDRIVSAIRPGTASSWMTSEPLTTSGSASGPQISLDARGDATALWTFSTGTDRVIQSVRRGSTAGEWSSPIDVSPGLGVRLAVDVQGNATAIWGESDGTAVRTASRLVGSETWTAPTDLIRDSRGLYYYELASGDNGASAAVFLRGQIGSFVVQAAVRRSPVSAWGPPSDLTGEFRGAAFPQVAVSAAGAVAIWGQAESETAAIRAAAFDDGIGPVVRTMLTPQRSFVGLPVTVHSDAHDIWSRPTTTTWTFRPGRTAIGATAVHIFPRAGKYRVTARSVDAIGNPTEVAAAIDVTPLPRCQGPLIGDERSNVLKGTPRADLMIGGAGNDQLLGNRGNDCGRGGTGNDLLSGGRGIDQLLGGPGRDSLIGGRGDDVLRGGRDEDYLQGDQGADVLLGGAGDDNIAAVDGGTDTIDCGVGTRDRARVDRVDVAVGCEFLDYPAQ